MKKNKSSLDRIVNYLSSNTVSITSDEIALYLVKTNNDWMNIRNINTNLISLSSNDYYFSYRSIENGSIGIIVNPFVVDKLNRLVKDSTKFNSTMLYQISKNNIDPSSKESSNEASIVMQLSELDILTDETILLIEPNEWNEPVLIKMIETVFKTNVYHIIDSKIIKRID